MGGQPLFALALVAMPIDKLPLDTIRRILDGGGRSGRASRHPPSEASRTASVIAKGIPFTASPS